MNNPTLKIAVAVNNLKLKYRGTDSCAIDKLSFSIYDGEIFGLLGPNGAGKTTTINILTGLLKQDEGEALISGHNINGDFNKLKALIGVVPQEISLFSNLSVKQNLLIYGNLYGIKKDLLKSRITSLLEDYGLSEKANVKVKNLSGGMSRRLNIIVGILHSPKLLFLDEPTVGIDVQSKNFIISNLRQLNKSGITILYTSHYMDEAEKFCSRIGIIDQGKIIALDSPEELIEKNDECEDLEDVFLHLTGRKIRD
jgi:ABC-2 type transport system ATP-binding protein